MSRTPRNPIHASAVGGAGRRRSCVLAGPGAGARQPTARGIDERMQGRAVEGGARRRLHRQGQDARSRSWRPAGIDTQRADAARNGQGRQGARPAAARRLCLRPDQRPQGRGRHHHRRPGRPRRGERRGVRRRSRATAPAAQLHLQEIPHHASRRGRRRGANRREGRASLVIQCAKPDAAAKLFAVPQGAGGGRVPRRAISSTSRPTCWAPSEFAERMRDLSRSPA